MHAEMNVAVGRSERESRDPAEGERTGEPELEPGSQGAPDVAGGVRVDADLGRGARLLGVAREGQLDGDVEPAAPDELPYSEPELRAGKAGADASLERRPRRGQVAHRGADQAVGSVVVAELDPHRQAAERLALGAVSPASQIHHVGPRREGACQGDPQ